MRNVTIIAVLLLALLIGNKAYAVVEISDDSVLALYHLEDTVDSSGNGLNFSNNSVTFDVGKLNDASTFDNTSDYLTNTSVSDFNVPSLAFSFWFKASSNGDMVNQRSSGQYKFTIRTESEHIVVDQWNLSAGSYAQYVGTSDIVDGSWHHAIVNINANYRYVWLDGNYEGGNTSSVDWGQGSTAPFRIGQGADNNSSFSGQVDELVIKSGTFDTSTREALYNSGSGAEVCVTAGCGSSSTPSSSTSTAMTDFETFLAYQLLLALSVTIAIGTYIILT